MPYFNDASWSDIFMPDPSDNDVSYRLMFLNAPVGMALISWEGRFMEVNPRLCQMLGYTHEELITLNLQQITFPEDLAATFERLRQMNTGKTRRFSLEKRYRRRDGQGIWVNVTISAILDESDQPTGYIASFEDISEKKAYEETLEIREEKYRTVIETATDGFWLIDLQGRVVEVNDAYCRLVGYAREEIIGRSIVDFVLESAEEVAQNLAACLTAKTASFETEHRCKDGSRIPLLVTAVYNPALKDLAFAFFHDLRSVKAIMHALESLYEEQHTLVDALPDFVVSKDKEGHWRSANQNALRLFQLEAIDWVGKTDQELASERPQCRELLAAFAHHQEGAWQSRKIQIVHQWVTDTEGNRRFLEKRLIPLFDAEGRRQSILFIARDITALEQAEEDKKAAEKTHAVLRRRAHEAETALVNLSEFTLRQIGQELHDDLGQVLTGAAMLANSIALKMESKRPQEAATARQLTHVLNAAVEKTRLISHGLAPIELDKDGLLPMLHSLAKHIHTTQGIAVSVSEHCPPLSLGKEAALHVFRIIQEATSNVVRHSGATALLITLEARNDTLTLSVLDNGIGITEDMSQGSYKGIGISNMRARADLIGAHLDINKRKQGGTAVVLSMPLPIGGT